MGNTIINQNYYNSYTKLASFSATTSFAEYTLTDDLTNYKYIYIATYASGAPSSSTQSWGGTFIPTSMFIDMVFGAFVISFRGDYYIEIGVGTTTKKVSAKASDQYTRGITIYGLK